MTIFEDLDQKLEESTFLLGENQRSRLTGSNSIVSYLAGKKEKTEDFVPRRNPRRHTRKSSARQASALWGELYLSACPNIRQRLFIKISRIAKAELTKESFEPDPKRISA